MDAIERLDWLIGSFRIAQVIRTCAVLGICDALADGPVSAAEVAASTQADVRAIGRLLRSLSAIGLLDELPDGRYGNTELGELLREDNPSALRSVALGRLDARAWNAWGGLPEAVRTGNTAYELVNSSSFWTDLADDPTLAVTFNAFIGARTRRYAETLVQAFDFAASRHIVDVGGGQGTLLASLLTVAGEARGTLFDRAAGLVGTEGYLTARGVRDRVDLVAGDFFEAVPAGADIYLLRQILHDWTDADAARILETCRDALSAPASRLLIGEVILPEHAVEGPDHEARFVMDINMMVLFGARERTERELRGMLAAAGFAVDRVLGTRPEATIVARRH